MVDLELHMLTLLLQHKCVCVSKLIKNRALISGIDLAGVSF